MTSFWSTALTQVRPNEIRVRGYDVAELMGSRSFGDVVYLLMSGELPSGREGAMVEAILVAGADHSVAAPSTAAARLVASGGAPLQAAAAAGIIALDAHHGGAMEALACMLQEALGTAAPPGERPGPAPKLPDDEIRRRAAAIVDEALAARRRLPGFGHPVHKRDPRTERLRVLAQEWGLYVPHFRLVDAIGGEMAARGKPAAVNVDGAIAGILSDLRLDWRISRGFYVIARAAGLVAHVYEQSVREKPFKAPSWSEIEYLGPGPRPVPCTDEPGR